MHLEVEYSLSQYQALNTSSLNNTIEFSKFILLKSFSALEKTRKINLMVTILFLIIGLIGHFLTIFVFIQKRFRKNSCNVYLLCLATNDALFLVMHFFEDTIRTFKDIFVKNEIKIINSINLIDMNRFTCYSISYLRYVLRFISAYTIVAFTVQRLYSICAPFSQKFKSTKSAWNTVSIISIISIFINIWVPFQFEMHSENIQNDEQYCDVRQGQMSEYFHMTLVYIVIIILIPIVVIFICNLIIIFNLFQSGPDRNGLKINKSEFRLKKEKDYQMVISSNSNVKIRPYYLSINQIINRVTRQANSSKRITKMLILISFTYAFLNLPYLIAWSCFYYGFIFNSEDVVVNNYLYAAVKISEIFYLLNYSIYFYIYYASGSVFRNQLKYSTYSSKLNKNTSYFKVEFYAEH